MPASILQSSFPDAVIADDPQPSSVCSPTRRLLALYMQLTKARLSALVVVTTAVGFIMASAGSIDWLRLLWTVLG
ncbi:MAG: hypothetical protein V3T53_15330, partial [Phycisphaerales bacterium]